MPGFVSPLLFPFQVFNRCSGCRSRFLAATPAGGELTRDETSPFDGQSSSNSLDEATVE
jgi:hypothetical protein